MDNKNWITQLAEKKPSPALVAGMIVVIMTMFTWIGFLYSEIGKARREGEEKLDKAEVSHQIAIYKKDSINGGLQNKLDVCANLIVQRTDDFFKQQRQEYLDRINEQKVIESKRSKLLVERNRLLKSNASQINTLETIQNNEN